MRVVVIGGGVAGLCAAYFLRRDGAEVMVLEADRIGAGASCGNAGWICPAQAGPLPEPDLTAYGLRSLFRRDSALYIAPGQLPAMVGWFARFARRCNERDHRRGTEALARLGQRTFALLDEFASAGIAFTSYRRGMLVVAEQRETAERFLRGLAPLREFGFEIPEVVLDSAETQEREPLLSSLARAGIAIEEHIHVEPMTLVHGLADHLKQIGATIEEGCEVTNIVALDGGVAFQAGGAERRADALIVAAGAWTSPIMRRAGVRVPIAPGKGYSFEVPEPAGGGPRSSLLLLDAHVGLSPFADRIRIAGTMEFSGLNTRVDPRRIESIVRRAAPLLPGLDLEHRTNPWTGMRPIAPDGLPVIDRVPGSAHIYVASGYSMLGMTLAAPAGAALAEMVRSGRRPAVLAPFRIDRFRRIGS